MRARVNGKPAVKKFGPYRPSTVEKGRAFARRVSAEYGTRAVLQAEAPMGYQATVLAVFEGGKAAGVSPW